MSQQSQLLIAGVDEAGRGPLAGPVIAAAVILPPKHTIKGLKDSKRLTAEKRESLFATIIKCCVAYAVGRAEVNEIDTINILQASMLAMQRAVETLGIKPHEVLVDGNRCPKLAYPTEAVIKGDETIPLISAASILAKVVRDRKMIEYDQQYPGYGFAQHKGYTTPQHLAAIRKLGITEIHRKSFAPCSLCKT